MAGCHGRQLDGVVRGGPPPTASAAAIIAIAYVKRNQIDTERLLFATHVFKDGSKR
jgi:hypothetical protein